MAFEDVKESIQWAKMDGTVVAYFTMHSASANDNEEKIDRDTVHYANGLLRPKGDALAGELGLVFANTSKTGFVPAQAAPGADADAMERKTNLSYALELHADGTIGVQMKIAGRPVGNLPMKKLAGESVGTGLLRAADGTSAYTVSLDRRPRLQVPK